LEPVRLGGPHNQFFIRLHGDLLWPARQSSRRRTKSALPNIQSIRPCTLRHRQFGALDLVDVLSPTLLIVPLNTLRTKAVRPGLRMVFTNPNRPTAFDTHFSK
jgi:hypothetical protein